MIQIGEFNCKRYLKKWQAHQHAGYSYWNSSQSPKKEYNRLKTTSPAAPYAND
jgi:hypothetical protein